MLDLNVRVDMSGFNDKIRSVESDQAPYVLARALSETAKGVALDLAQKLPEVFDRPTPFTLRAFGVEYARKGKNPRARVFIKPAQVKYLQLEITGGVRTPTGRAIRMPLGVKLNSFGNMSRGQISALLNRKDVFSGEIRGRQGLWQRGKNGELTLLVAWGKQAKYKPRLKFKELAAGFARGRFDAAFALAAAAARRTAR